MSRGVDIVILAEDERLRMLLRRYLIKLGYTHHKIRELLPSVFSRFETSCLLWVQEEYPDQVQAMRDKARHITTALIIGIDADEETVAARLSEMNDLLKVAGIKRRGGNEHIAIVVARRNVETWMYYLEGNSVDETTDYKPLCKNLDNRKSALKLANLLRESTLPSDVPASIQKARDELHRVPST